MYVDDFVLCSDWRDAEGVYIMSEYKYLEYILYESGTDEAECLRKRAGGGLQVN